MEMYEGAPQDISDHHEMKLGLPNYAVIMSISKYSSCIRTNNKLNSLQNHDTAQNYKNLHRVISVCTNITSKFCTIAIFKSCARENIDSSKICNYS
jgi:hypothetical protein